MIRRTKNRTAEAVFAASCVQYMIRTVEMDSSYRDLLLCPTAFHSLAISYHYLQYIREPQHKYFLPVGAIDHLGVTMHPTNYSFTGCSILHVVPHSATKSLVASRRKKIVAALDSLTPHLISYSLLVTNMIGYDRIG